MPRESFLATNLARTRQITTLNQTAFADALDLKLTRVQNVESGRAKLTEEEALRVAALTGVSARWLLENDTKSPVVTPFGEPYEGQHFIAAQAKKNAPPPEQRRDLRGELLNSHCHLRAIFSAAQAKGCDEERVALYRLGVFLEEMKQRFGYDKAIYDVGDDVRGVRFGSRTLKLAKEDVAAVERDNAAFFNEHGPVAPFDKARVAEIPGSPKRARQRGGATRRKS